MVKIIWFYKLQITLKPPRFFTPLNWNVSVFFLFVGSIFLEFQYIILIIISH